jgi:tetratricopeptide (TPR) repeat protein
MKRRTLRSALLLFLCGMVVLSFGFFGFSYDRAQRAGRKSYQAKYYYDATLALQRLSSLPFSDPRTNYNLGIAMLALNKYDLAAMAPFRKFILLSKDPKMKAEGYYLLAWSIVGANYSKRYDEALGYLAEAMRLDTSHKGAKNLYERLSHLRKNQPPQNEQLKPDPGTQPGRTTEEPKP